MKFAKLMATPLGRLARVLAGLLIVYWGLARLHGVGGAIVALIGLVPLAAGAFNYCTIAALIGAPFWGKDARGATPKHV